MKRRTKFVLWTRKFNKRHHFSFFTNHLYSRVTISFDNCHFDFSACSFALKDKLCALTVSRHFPDSIDFDKFYTYRNGQSPFPHTYGPRLSSPNQACRQDLAAEGGKNQEGPKTRREGHI